MTELQSLSYKILPILVLLGGCAVQQTESFEPYAVEITDQKAYSNDLWHCREYALNYLNKRSSVSPSQVAQEGLRTGMSDLGYSAISPTAPALGALGGASSEVLSELGLNSVDARRIISKCMTLKGQKSNNYLSIDPN